MISHLQADDKVLRCTANGKVHPCCCYDCRKLSDDDVHLTSAFIERTSGGNGMQGMCVGDSVQYHAWYVSRLSRRNHMCGMQGMTRCNGTQDMWSG